MQFFCNNQGWGLKICLYVLFSVHFFFQYFLVKFVRDGIIFWRTRKEWSSYLYLELLLLFGQQQQHPSWWSNGVNKKAFAVTCWNTKPFVKHRKACNSNMRWNRWCVVYTIEVTQPHMSNKQAPPVNAGRICGSVATQNKNPTNTKSRLLGEECKQEEDKKKRKKITEKLITPIFDQEWRNERTCHFFLGKK